MSQGKLPGACCIQLPHGPIHIAALYLHAPLGRLNKLPAACCRPGACCGRQIPMGMASCPRRSSLSCCGYAHLRQLQLQHAVCCPGRVLSRDPGLVCGLSSYAIRSVWGVTCRLALQGCHVQGFSPLAHAADCSAAMWLLAPTLKSAALTSRILRRLARSRTAWTPTMHGGHGTAWRCPSQPLEL